LETFIHRHLKQPAWTQLRDYTRIILGLFMLSLSLFLYDNRDSHTLELMRQSFLRFDTDLFILALALHGGVVIVWYKLRFWGIFAVATPLHIYYAFVVAGGSIGVILFSTVIYAQIFLVTLWIAERNNGGKS
jgi:hypothetical protein